MESIKKSIRQSQKNSTKEIDCSPICVDLDGTLVNTNILLESLFVLLKRNFFYTFYFPIWLIKGRAHLKEQIAHRVALDISTLPYNWKFLKFLITEKQLGKKLVLATGANQQIASQIAQHLGIFDQVLASDNTVNLTGQKKSRALINQFGRNKFEYAGNCREDLAIWGNAQKAIVVNGSPRLVEAVGMVVTIRKHFPGSKFKVGTLVRALRPHQWIKNALVVVPLLTAHKLFEPALLVKAILAFFSFTLCASGIYVLNDLLDLSADRRHSQKKYRPFAAGKLSLLCGMAMIPAFVLGAFTISLALPLEFQLDLGLYVLLAIAYSLFFKKLVIGDVMVLAGLYTIRIIAGADAIGVPMSYWLLTFGVFIFFSMAMVKRYTELDLHGLIDNKGINGRGYTVADKEWIRNLGAVSGLISIFVFMLYMQSREITALYNFPERLWLICPIFLFWIGRVWLLTYKGQLPDDPIVFALKDPTTYVIGILTLMIMWIAL